MQLEKESKIHSSEPSPFQELLSHLEERIQIRIAFYTKKAD